MFRLCLPFSPQTLPKAGELRAGGNPAEAQFQGAVISFQGLRTALN